MCSISRFDTSIVQVIAGELRRHVPFTLFGALTGVALAVAVFYASTPRYVSQGVFWVLHPLHVVLSALTTGAMYRLHRKVPKWWAVVLIGYCGSIGIATLSDSVIPYLGESLLNLPNRGIHLGFIEKWWLINPLALLGILVASVRPTTRIPHAGHVLLSTWASLFHMMMALGSDFDVTTLVLMTAFLFLAVWVPCCASDIVFPLLFSSTEAVTSGCADPTKGENDTGWDETSREQVSKGGTGKATAGPRRRPRRLGTWRRLDHRRGA